jgi:hypothetical protein
MDWHVGAGYGGPEFLFSKTGTFPRYIDSHVRPLKLVQQKLGLRMLSHHKVGRHSVASQAVTGGESVKAVQAQLGHQSEHSTHQYAHLGSGAQRRLMDALKPARCRELPRTGCSARPFVQMPSVDLTVAGEGGGERHRELPRQASVRERPAALAPNLHIPLCDLEVAGCVGHACRGRRRFALGLNVDEQALVRAHARRVGSGPWDRADDVVVFGIDVDRVRPIGIRRIRAALDHVLPAGRGQRGVAPPNARAYVVDGRTSESVVHAHVSFVAGARDQRRIAGRRAQVPA